MCHYNTMAGILFLLLCSHFKKNKVKLQQHSFSHVLSYCYETAWGKFHNFLPYLEGLRIL